MCLGKWLGQEGSPRKEPLRLTVPTPAENTSGSPLDSPFPEIYNIRDHQGPQETLLRLHVSHPIIARPQTLRSRHDRNNGIPAIPQSFCARAARKLLPELTKRAARLRAIEPTDSPIEQSERLFRERPHSTLVQRQAILPAAAHRSAEKMESILLHSAGM